MKLKSIFTIASLFLTEMAMAQLQSLSGTVTDARNNPLSGVGIHLENSSVRTFTDHNGHYHISAPQGAILIFDWNGQTESRRVDNHLIMNVVFGKESSIEQVVILGSRTGARSQLESPVPVDVFNMEELSERMPQGSLTRMLNAVVPSFSSVTHSGMNLTDHVDPATLRGMPPDQTLVLLNGKRYHTSALMNDTGGSSMGSVGTDLNSIPAFALQKIEVLRDGASAQYGSDAIAGVMDLELKRSTKGLTGQLSYGGYLTPEADNFHKNWDGNQIQLDLNYGTKLGKKNGFLNVTGSFQFHDRTSRSGDYTGKVYDIYNAVDQRAREGGVDLNKLYGNINQLQGQGLNSFIGLIKQYAQQVAYLDPSTQSQIQNAAGLSELQNILKNDVSDQELGYRGLQRRDFNMHVGQSKTNTSQIYFNTEVPLNQDWKVYGFGGFNYRYSTATGYNRYPYEGVSILTLFPNGYLPTTEAANYDFTTTAGLKGTLDDWKLDFSNTIDENDITITDSNTVNASLTYKSPTTMKVGGYRFLQNTTNLDAKKSYAVLSGLNLAFGAEYRFENYQITAGDPVSYQNYDLQGNVVTTATPAANRATDFYGNILPGGAQDFGGLNPSNAVDKNRNSVAAYGEAALNFTKGWLVDGAVRYEHYSDFGNTVNFKLASLIRLAKNLNFRLAGSTGFRAPSMAQIYYNTTSGLLTNGVSKTVGLFRNDSEMAQLMGIPKLTEEKSRSFSTGFTYQIPSANINFTADGFITRVNNQIILTGTFAAPTGTNLSPGQQAVADIFNQQNIGYAEFFANAIDVVTKGFDFIVSHQYSNGRGLRLKNDFGLNLNQVKRVGAIHASPLLEAAGLVDSYFDEHSKIYLEREAPRIKMSLLNSLSIGKLDFFLQNSYFGKVWGADNVNAFQPNLPYVHQIYHSKVITDLSIGYRFTKDMTLTLGSSNLFDVYPDKPAAALNYYNQFTQDVRISQISINGRYVFARLNFAIR